MNNVCRVILQHLFEMEIHKTRCSGICLLRTYSKSIEELVGKDLGKDIYGSIVNGEQNEMLDGDSASYSCCNELSQICNFTVLEVRSLKGFQ